jgi:uncharacterized membrane protein
MASSSIARLRGLSALLIVAAVVVVVAISWGATARAPQFTVVRANPSISIETEDLRPGAVRFFVYRDQAGDQIRFFLARDATGRIKAAFDACQRCYKYHKGYVFSGGELRCKFCGNRYKLEAIESGIASCVPIKLPFQIAGQTVTVKPADLERQRALF